MHCLISCFKLFAVCQIIVAVFLNCKGWCGTHCLKASNKEEGKVNGLLFMSQPLGHDGFPVRGTARFLLETKGAVIVSKRTV